MADTGKHMSKSKNKSEVKLKYTTIVNQGDGTENNQENNLSLQEAFKRYRKAKQKELRKAKLLRKRNELRKADPAKMEVLRKKFVEQAKKYFGYPYARKYWPPDSPEYKSKLFLDCCGLVRQVMRDLMYDFGFIIGPWNQAYMYDTLPKTVKSEEDMKPGDLVFISATYYNPKSKKQRHNMTHVEIWLGDGPKTIGARWNNGKVQVFDSYKFTAKSYYNETYHFKSIDTWLKGICESFCSEHRWKRRKYTPSKKSIFHVSSDQDLTQQQDEPAGDDGNVDTVMMRGTTFCAPSMTTSASSKSLDEKQGTPDDTDDTDDEMCDASPDEEQELDAVETKEEDIRHAEEGVHAKECTGAGDGVKRMGEDNTDVARSGKDESEVKDGNELKEHDLLCKGVHKEKSLSECCICERKLGVESNINVSKDDIDKQDNADQGLNVTQSTDDELVGSMQKMVVTNPDKNFTQNALPKNMKEEEKRNGQNISVTSPDENYNQNALPIEKKDEDEKRNGQNNSGARPKTYTSRSDAAGIEALGELLSVDGNAVGSRAETDMNTLSDINLTGSPCSDKGA